MIDTHCHLDDAAFDADRTEVLSRALAVGVEAIVVPATRLEPAGAIRAASWKRDAALRILPAVGVHPEHASGWNAKLAARLVEMARDPAFVAVGETGLDRVHAGETIEAQKDSFRAHIAASRETGKPLLVHSRSPMEEVLGMLLDGAPENAPPAVLHAFGGDGLPDPARLPSWIFLGIGGIFTFKKSEDLRGYVSRFPRERVLIETDAPYLSPEPFRGKRNEPARIVSVCARLAEGWNVSPAETAATTSANALRFLSLPGARD